MIINELLVEKYQTQKILDKIAHHNLAKYVEDTHSRVQQLSAKLGLDLRYGTPSNAPHHTPYCRFLPVKVSGG